MTVVVLSICPERLRGQLTRWLLEISAGVYVGHVPARVRERLWLRILEDVGKGRALMVYSTRGEQRFSIRVHNHSWEPVENDGLILMRRTTADSRALAKASVEQHKKREGRDPNYPDGGSPTDPRSGTGPVGETRRNWSKAARRRRFRNTVEKRHGET